MSRLNTTKPPLEDLVPAYVPTPEEVRGNQKREQASKVGVGQAFKDVANADWIPMWAFRQVEAGSVGRYDPEFSASDPKYWKQLTDGLDPAYHEMFGEATNIDMAMKIRQQALSIQKSNENIASLGGWGIAARLAGNVLDPVNIAIGVATGGGGFIARNASRAERLIAGGLLTTAAAAPTEVYRTVRDPLQDSDDFMLNMGLAFSIGGIANAIPKTVRAQQAVRAGLATVEETPTSFIIRPKQPTKSPPDVREPGLVVWERPRTGQEMINRANRPTEWADVVVPKMQGFDWRAQTADETTRFNQDIPMRSAGNSPILPPSKQQLALPEANGVSDSTQTGQPVAPGSPIGPVGMQPSDGGSGAGAIGGTGSQPQRPQLPTPRKAGRGAFSRADTQRRLDEAVAKNPAVEADNFASMNDVNESRDYFGNRYSAHDGLVSFTFRTRKGWNEFKSFADGNPELLRLARFDDRAPKSNRVVQGPAGGGKGEDAEDFIASLPGGIDEYIEIARRVLGGRSRREDVAQKNLSVDPASRFYFWFRDNLPVVERRKVSAPDFDTWHQQRITGKGRGRFKKLDMATRKAMYQKYAADIEAQRKEFKPQAITKKDIIDSPSTSLPDGTVFKIHGHNFEVVQNQYGEMTMVQRNPDGTQMPDGELVVELHALDELPIDAGSLRTVRDPAPKVEYPSVDEMLARVEATGIDPYADVIVDTRTGDIVPMTDDIDPDTLMPRNRADKEHVVDAITKSSDRAGDMVEQLYLYGGFFGDDFINIKQKWRNVRKALSEVTGEDQSIWDSDMILPDGYSRTELLADLQYLVDKNNELVPQGVGVRPVTVDEILGASGSNTKRRVVNDADTPDAKAGSIIDPETGEPMVDPVMAPENLDDVVFGDAPTDKRVEIDPETGEPMVDAVNAPDDLGDFVPSAADAPKQPWEMKQESAKTDGATTVYGFAGEREAFKIRTGDGAQIIGRVANVDFPGAKSIPDRGEIFSIDVPESERRSGKGTKLVEDAIRLIAANGGKTVKLTVPNKKYGQPFVDALIERGTLGEVVSRDSRTGTLEVRIPESVLADYPDLQPNVTPKIPDPRTLEERITAKIDEINRRRKNSPGVKRGDNTGGTILFAELVDLVHEIALRAVRAGVRGADNIGKIFDELTAGKDPEIQTLRKDIIAKAERYVSEPELIEANYRLHRQAAEEADEIRGAKAKTTPNTAPKESVTSGNTPKPPTETPPGVGGTPKGPGDFDLTGREYKGGKAAGSGLGKIRVSMANALQKSASPFAQWIGQATGEIAVMSKGWFNNAAEKFVDSASEATDRVFRSKITRLVAETDPIWKKYAEQNKLNFVERVIRDKFRDEFHDKIGVAIRAGRSDDPLIESARKAYAKHFKDLLEYGKKYGLPGFDKIPPDETYLWRVWDHSKIASMTDRHTHSSLVELLTKAALNKNQDLDEAATREVMGYFLSALHNRQYGLDLDKNLAFTSARDTVESVIDALGLERNKAQDLINRAKGRMVLDENASIETAAGTLRMSDLFDNNAETIAHVYARNVVGASHMQEVFRAAEGYWGRKVNSLAELLDLISRDGAAVGADPERLKYDISKAKAIAESILGHRSAQATYWTKASIAIRGINHLARSGSFAIAQIPEAGRVIAGGGIQAAFNNMPVMKDILTSIYSGKPDTRLLQEIQDIWALGTEPLVNHPVRRFDFREAGDQFLNYSQFNRQLNKAQYWASNISGMTYIQNVQQKWAGAAFVNTWANMKSMPSKARLTTLGLDEAMAQKIMDNIKQHGTTETGPLGVRVKQLNIEKWDKDAASKFIVAGDKWTRNAVQQNNVALYSEWMTGDTGKVLTQFRSFMVGAYEKQFMQPGQILIASRGKDFEAWMSFMVPAFLGGLAYITQTHMNSVGRADRDKYLKDMLSDEKIGLAAFNRGGAASILPMATDWVSDSIGFGKPFGYARSSGLESHPFLGNPTFDVLANTPDSLRTLRAAFDPNYNATQADMRNFRKIVPGQNLPVVKNILDYYQTRLPKERNQR